ncbi:MAG: hypothetical protein ACRCS0_11205 [Albidovulum sp.]
MASDVGSLAVLAVLGCVPPLLCLLACRRRMVLARETGETPGWLQGALVFAAAALLLNLILVTASAIRASYEPGWTRLEAAILLIGWAAFWLWIGLVLTRQSRRKRRVY